MSIVPFDPTLVSQSVNFHGHNLLKQLVSENAVQIHTIKLQDIDYKVYQNRSTEIRNLGFSRIQEVIGFIASKSDILLVKQPKPCISVEGQKEQDYKDRNSHILPFEYLLHVDKNIRISEVLSTIKTGDILFTEVHSNAEYGCCHLKLLAFDGGVHRYVSDFRPSDVKVVMNYEETVVSKADEDKVGKWLLGTRLRVEVLVVKLDKTLSVICVGTKGTTIPDNMKDKIKLGKVQLQDLPPILSVIPDPNMKYLSQCFMKMATFKNPQCVRQKASELNIDMHSYPSLLTTFRGHISDVGKPNALRKAQMCKWAHKSVADGVTYFKKGQHEEAFQCLNKALQIDPENVEAFVAKGALLANLGRYEKAIEDFEKAMKFNPQHVNARKYMCETLVELGKQSEETGQLKEAEKCYSKCLELSGDHVVAREALESVESKLGIKPEPDKLIKDEQTEVDNFLLDLLEMENELKRQNAEENKNPDIKEEKLLTIPSLADEVPKVEDTKEKEPSLSPLSQKLAVQQKLWESPLFANAAQSTLPPPAENKPLPISMPEVNIFSNPPPNWPIPDLTKPPPPAVDYSEDPSYKARVEQFLKELEIRSRGPEKKPKRSREDQREKRSSQRAKKKRRKRKGSSSSSNSSSSSDSSSSDSEKEPAKNRKSSLSDSSGSTESADEHKTSKSKKQKKKKKKKKTKKSKSKSKKNVTKEPEMPIPDFQDLENKLLAYYQKMEAIKETPPDKESKPSKNPLKGLKTSSHPAFLDGSPSDSPETDIKTVKPVPPKSTSTASKHKITKDDPKKKMKKKKHISSSSCSTCSSSSRSRSRSFSSRSSSSSGGHYSRYRKRHSRSRPYRGSRRRYSRSRSRRRSRSRKRSRSRRRSRSRQRHFRHSRSRSPRHKRPICSPKKHHVPRRSPPSPGFGYYRNKPVISAQTKGVPTPLPNVDTVPLPPPTNKPPEHKGPKPIKFQIKKMLGAKAVIEKHLSGNLKETPTQPKEESCDSKEVVASPDSARFGKWAKEGTVPKSASATNGKKTPTPAGSLDQFEKFLQSAKQKSIEMMKERNKAFLKPKVE